MNNLSSEATWPLFLPDMLLSFLIMVVILAAVAYGAYRICIRFQMPPIVFWIVGTILLIVFLVKASQILGVKLP